MDPIKPITELDAVNILLMTIGEAPINSFIGEQMDDVAIARSVLREVSHEVQRKGWHFNREYDVTFPRTVNGEIPVPNNVAALDVLQKYHPMMDVVNRGGKLYDLKAHTTKFTDELRCVVVYYLPFEELPETGRYYVTIRAARKFANRVAASKVIYQFTKEDEVSAYSDFFNENAENSDWSMLHKPDVRMRLGNRGVRRHY